MSKLFPAIAVAKSFGVEMPIVQAHERVLAALHANGYHNVEDLSDEIKAEHGNTGLFIYGTVSGDIAVALAASPSAEYPVSVDVQFHEIEGGNARSSECLLHASHHLHGSASLRPSGAQVA